jgi:hypothetical protein
MERLSVRNHAADKAVPVRMRSLLIKGVAAAAWTPGGVDLAISRGISDTCF